MDATHIILNDPNYTPDLRKWAVEQAVKTAGQYALDDFELWVRASSIIKYVLIGAHHAEGPYRGWSPMDSAPKDGTVIEACAKFKNATAGSPTYVAWMMDAWRELGREFGEPMDCWAWRPRTDFPQWEAA